MLNVSCAIKGVQSQKFKREKRERERDREGKRYREGGMEVR